MADNLTSQLTRALMDYSRTTEEEINKILKDVGNEGKQKLNTTSPKRLGKYHKGWRVKLERRSGTVTVHIHNEIYRLVHLLEKGHNIHHGGHAAAKVHVEPVDTWAKEEAMRRIEEAIRR